jgi:ATP-binding cassette, subfamily B, bacterial MsbA
LTKKELKISRNETLLLSKRLILDYALRHKQRFLIAVASMILVGGATSAIAWLSRSMVNNIFVHGDQNAVWLVGLAIMAAFAVKGIASYSQTVLMGTIGCNIVAELQQVQFQKLVRLKLMDYGTHPGAAVSKAIQSARSARNAIVLVTTNLVRDLFTVICLLGVMVFQDPFMSIFAFLFAPLIVWVVARIIKETKRLTQSEADMIAGLNVLGTEALQGIRIVKSFNLESVMDNKIGKAIAKMEGRQAKLIRVSSLTGPMFDIVAGLTIGLFIFYAGWQTLNFGKTPGEFMAFITAFLLAYDPAKRLGNLNVQLQREMVGVKRLFALIDEKEPEVSHGSVVLHCQGGAVSFDDVAFSYRAGTPAVQNLSLSIGPGEKIAIVGRSGAGKSTLMNLLLGMYQPNSGRVMIDGIDIATVTLDSLRASISYVSQETFLFSGTVRDNIAFGKPDATDAEVLAALDASHAKDFVEALPEGINTHIGANGSSLSGGQRQRISIARAFLKDAPILLLDEATSALDGETERYIQDALAMLSEGRTTIVIAHRLSTIRACDRVVIMDGGHIVAEGTHAELEAGSELYHRLFAIKEIL